jgi:hypothetical protein
VARNKDRPSFLDHKPFAVLARHRFFKIAVR